MRRALIEEVRKRYWEGPPLDARRAEVALELLDAALELLEITHEGLQCVAR